MEYSGTKSGDMVKQRFNSYTSWIKQYDDNNDEEDPKGEGKMKARAIASHMTDLSSFLFVRDELKDYGDESTVVADCEPLQVVRYEPGGKYDVHHDAMERFLTVLTYLNGVAGTWFPYAQVEEYSKGKVGVVDEQAPDMTSKDTIAKDKTPGKDGVLIVGKEYEQDPIDIKDTSTITIDADSK